MKLLQVVLLSAFICLSYSSQKLLLNFGETFATQEKDEFTELLPLKASFVFYGQTIANFSVNENGVISLGETFPNAYPRLPDEDNQPPFIAGFAGHIETPSNISYKQLSDEDEDRFYESKAHVLNLLREGFGGSMAGFDPTHILLVTWDRAYSTIGTTATFQIVVVSEAGKKDTYALLLYQNISWNDGNIVIGFNAGDGEHSFQQDPPSGGLNSLDSSTNAHRPGAYVYRIHDEKIVVPTEVEKNEDICITSFEDLSIHCDCPNGYVLAENNINCNVQEKLELKFFGDTPFVFKDNLTAYFRANREGVSFLCKILRNGETKENCSSGVFHRSGLTPYANRRYTLQVEAVDPKTGESVVLKSKFRVQGDQQRIFCGVHIINAGSAAVRKQGGYVEYVGTGASRGEFWCKLNRERAEYCGDVNRIIPDNYFSEGREVYRLSAEHLKPGRNRLVVFPSNGCQYHSCYKQTTYIFKVAN